MTQEHIDRCARQCNLIVQEMANGMFEEAVDRLEMLTIYFKEVLKEESDNNEQA